MLTRMYNHLLNGSGYKYVTIQRAWDQTSNIERAWDQTSNIDSAQWGNYPESLGSDKQHRQCPGPSGGSLT